MKAVRQRPARHCCVTAVRGRIEGRGKEQRKRTRILETKGRRGQCLRSHGIDDLFDRVAAGEDILFGELLDEDYKQSLKQEGPRKQPQKQPGAYDYADQQQLWPSGEDDSGYVDMPPYNPGPDPSKGPLHKQVDTGITEALTTDKIDPEHAKYWFTEPPGGWKTKSTRVKIAEEQPGFFATARNRETGRKSIKTLKPGERLRGVVSEIWYHHGIKVDIGYDYDGLLPMHKETWSSFGDRLDIDDRVDVIVEKLWKEDLYRWPVQLRAVHPIIQRYIIPSDVWDPPIDMRGKSIEEIEKYSNRRLPTEKWFVHEDEEEMANPYHETGSKDPPPRPELMFEDWARLELDYLDDMTDAAHSIREIIL